MLFCLIGFLLPAIEAIAIPQEATQLYVQKIKPLLTEKCTACHGAIRTEAGLRLDAIQFIRKGGDSGAITRSDKDGTKCVLMERVSTRDVDVRMPPEGEGAPLDDEQLALLDAWQKAGMPGPEKESYLTGPQDHWAFRPIVRPAMPQVTLAEDQVHNAIDAFIAANRQGETYEVQKTLRQSTGYDACLLVSRVCPVNVANAASK